jgi:hypothetical protein
VVGLERRTDDFDAGFDLATHAVIQSARHLRWLAT